MSRKLETGTFSVTAEKVTCYKVRHSSGFYWADITARVGNHSIGLQISSDFGDWQYYWGATGDDVAAFIKRLGIDYVAHKFGADGQFDVDGTIKNLLEQLKEYFKYEDVKDAKVKDKRRECFEALKELGDIDTSQESLFQHMYFTSILGDVLGVECFDVRKRITPQFTGFWQHIWPVFVEAFASDYYQLIATTQ